MASLRIISCSITGWFVSSCLFWRDPVTHLRKSVSPQFLPSVLVYTCTFCLLLLFSLQPMLSYRYCYTDHIRFCLPMLFLPSGSTDEDAFVFRKLQNLSVNMDILLYCCARYAQMIIELLKAACKWSAFVLLSNMCCSFT